LIHITQIKKVNEANEDGKPQAGILLETDGYFVCLLLLAILRQRQNVNPDLNNHKLNIE
jgi:hypothetical protein